MKAPVRDVVRVLEIEGERGGRMLVCVLACGCFSTRRSSTPPKRMPCVACFVKEQIAADVPAMERRYTHLVVIVREGVPEVRGFHDYAQAFAWYDEAGTQWSDSFLAEIIKGPLV